MKELRRFPVEPRWTILNKELHHLHHLVAAVADRLEDRVCDNAVMQKKKTKETKSCEELLLKCVNFRSTCRLSSAYLVVRLGVDWGAPLCALQRLLHLLYLDCQMGFKVAAQRHAGVLGRLPARENLVVAQQRPLILRVQDFKCADLKTATAQEKKEIESHTRLLLGRFGSHTQMSHGHFFVLPD